MPSVSRGVYRFLFHHGARLEDFSDRLNHVWTCALFLLLSAIVAWKHAYTKSIVCFCPTSCTENMVHFQEAVCWNSHRIQMPREEVSRTRQSGHNLPVVSRIYGSRDTEEETDGVVGVTLYQWIPIILCFQALLFKLPNIIMYSLHGYSGINFDKIHGLTSGIDSLSLGERHTVAKVTSRYLNNWCKMAENCLPWRWLTVVWMAVKFLYCVNTITQISLLDKLMRMRTNEHPLDNSTSYGDVILSNIFENNASLWKTSSSFPRTVMCQYSVQFENSENQFTRMCLLPVNAFSECVYMLVWVWLLFVAVITCTSLITWLVRTFIPFLRRRYLRQFLVLADDIQPTDIGDDELDTFANFVGEDGVYVLKLIGANSSDLIVRDIICSMWRMRRVSLRPANTKT